MVRSLLIHLFLFQYNLLPKGILSLKVLQELPIIVVLIYQIYKQNVHQEVAEFVPLIMRTINLQPSVAQMKSQDFNKEVFVDFMGAQIKTFSFLAYIIRPFTVSGRNQSFDGRLITNLSFSRKSS